MKTFEDLEQNDVFVTTGYNPDGSVWVGSVRYRKRSKKGSKKGFYSVWKATSNHKWAIDNDCGVLKVFVSKR